MLLCFVRLRNFGCMWLTWRRRMRLWKQKLLNWSS